MNAAAARGEMHPLSISQDIVDAAKHLAHLKSIGQSVGDYMSQQTMFGDRPLSPVAEDLLKMFDQNKRSAAKIAQTLNEYAKLVEDAGNPKEAGLFDAKIVPGPREVLQAARRLVAGEKPNEQVQPVAVRAGAEPAQEPQPGQSDAGAGQEVGPPPAGGGQAGSDGPRAPQAGAGIKAEEKPVVPVNPPRHSGVSGSMFGADEPFNDLQMTAPPEDKALPKKAAPVAVTRGMSLDDEPNAPAKPFEEDSRLPMVLRAMIGGAEEDAASAHVNRQEKDAPLMKVYPPGKMQGDLEKLAASGVGGIYRGEDGSTLYRLLDQGHELSVKIGADNSVTARVAPAQDADAPVLRNQTALEAEQEKNAANPAKTEKAPKPEQRRPASAEEIHGGGWHVVRQDGATMMGHRTEYAALHDGVVYRTGFPRNAPYNSTWEIVPKSEIDALKPHEGKRTTWGDRANMARTVQNPKWQEKAKAEFEQEKIDRKNEADDYAAQNQRLKDASANGYGVDPSTLKPGDVLEWAGDKSRHVIDETGSDGTHYIVPESEYGTESGGSVSPERVAAEYKKVGTAVKPEYTPDEEDSSPAFRDKLDDAEAAVRAKISDLSKGKVNSGLDPEILGWYAHLGAIKIAQGAATFADFSKAMIAEAGESVRPHIEDLYRAAQVFKAHAESQFARTGAIDAGAARDAAASRLRESSPKPSQDAPGDAQEGAAAVGGAEPVQTRKSAPANKAANLNLDRMNTPQEAKAALQKTALEMASEIQKQRRGVVTHEETKRAANDLGLSASDLAKITPGTAVPAHYAVAIRDLLLHHRGDVAEAAELYRRDPTEDSLNALNAAQAAYQAVFKTATGTAAEAGRALNSYKIMSQAFKGDPKAIADALFNPVAERAARTINPQARDFGARNTLFTKDRADAAKARILQASSRLNSGVDPLLLKDLVDVGGYYLEGGVKEFGAWSAQMKAAVGAKIATDENLKAAWAQIRQEAQARAAKPTGAAGKVQDALKSGLSNGDAARMASEVAAIAPDDFRGFNRVMQKYSRMTVGDSLVGLYKAGLLSHIGVAGKVVGSHLAYNILEEAKRAPAALADMAMSKAFGTDRTVQGASAGAFLHASKEGATRGVKEAGIIMREGKAGLQLRGLDLSGNASFSDDVKGEYSANLGLFSPAANAYVNAVYRVHGAYYHLNEVMAADRSLQEQAHLAAKADAKSGVGGYQERLNHYKDNPTPVMLASMAADAETAVFTNENRMSQIIAAGKRVAGPYKPLTDAVIPFSTVPVNIIARGLEYTPGGVIAPAARAAYIKALNKEMTPEMQRRFANTMGRGSVGTAAIALGTYLYSKGMLTPPDSKSHTPAFMKIGGKYVPVSDKAPAGTLLAVGALMGARNWSGDSKAQTENTKEIITALIGDTPMLSGDNQAQTLAADPARFAQGYAGSAVPGAVQDLAGALDPMRRKPDKDASLPAQAGQSVEEGIPGLREKVPANGPRLYNPLDPLRLRDSPSPPPPSSSLSRYGYHYRRPR